MTQDLNRAGARNRYDGRRRDHSHWPRNNSAFQEVEGRCEACGELIGDGTHWRRAIYHHTRLVRTQCQRQRGAGGGELHGAASGLPRRPQSVFTTCTGFFRTISEGSRDADSRAAGGSAAEVHHPGGAPGHLGRAILGWGGVAAFFSRPALIALAIVLLLSGVAVFGGGNLSPRRARGSRQLLGHRTPRADRAAGRLSARLHRPEGFGPSTGIPFAGSASFSSPPVGRCGSGQSLCSAIGSAGWSPSSVILETQGPRTLASARAAMTRRVSEASRDKASFHERNQVAPSDAGQTGVREETPPSCRAVRTAIRRSGPGSTTACNLALACRAGPEPAAKSFSIASLRPPRIRKPYFESECSRF